MQTPVAGRAQDVYPYIVFLELVFRERRETRPLGRRSLPGLYDDATGLNGDLTGL